MSDARVDELLQWLRDYASTRIDFRLQDERRCLQPHVVLDLGRRGILGGMRVPATYGGLDLPMREALRVIEQLGAIDLTLASWVGQNIWLGVQPIVDAGSTAHREEFLPALATGRILASFALTEPAAGSEPNGIQTSLTEVADGGFRLRGDKAWIGNASWAGVVNVFAKQFDQEGRPLGFTGCLVRSGTPGFEVGPELLTMGLRASVRNRIRFRDVNVPRSDLLGEPLTGFSVMHRAMQGARIVIGAATLGAMRRCLMLQHRYCTRRRISRGHLADYPTVVAAINEGIARAESIASIVRQVAVLEESLAAGGIPDQVYMCIKVMGSEFLWQVADRTVQLLGARGYTESNEVPRFMRDARVFRVFEGPTETLEYFIGSVDNRKLYNFLSQQLGAAEVVKRLEGAVATVRSRKDYFEGLLHGDSQHLLRSLVGHIVCWGVLLAFVDRAAGPGCSKPMQLSRDWVHLQFETAIAAAVGNRWPALLVCNIQEIGELLGAHEVTLVEPYSIDEVREIEPELRAEQTV
jgi:alkylation response protein AidB-like acyl-CoA dehydrogenase